MNPPKKLQRQNPLPPRQAQGRSSGGREVFYWAEHDLPPRSPILAPFTRKRVRRVAHPTPVARWRTLRDALAGLPEPVPQGETPALNWHTLWPGARLYRGHRGSDLDKPSKTIKAGVHGVAGGEHIVHLDSGDYRYLTVRECMRVQDLPDELEIDTTRTSAIRQIGNAVPPTIGEVFGRAIAQAVIEEPSVKMKAAKTKASASLKEAA